jgi:hypothetical protein
MEVLHVDHQPLEQLERYATRCQECHTIIRFVNEAILPEPPIDKEYPVIWVPMLLGDRRSRITPRALWEPCESAWQSLGGSGGRTFGFIDPTATLCEYPQKNEHVRMEKQWALHVDRQPLVATVFAYGELWTVTSNGAVHIFKAVDVNQGSTVTPASVEGSPARLGMPVAHPPAVRGAWWMFLSTAQYVKFIFRNPRMHTVQEWRIYPYQLGTGWQWEGAPFAIDGHNGGPVFAAVANHEDGRTVLFVFVLPEEPSSDSMKLAPFEVPIPQAINVPIQVPLAYAQTADTRRGRLCGQLVWVDINSNVYGIDTTHSPHTWSSYKLADAHSMIKQSPALPPLPNNLPPLPNNLPPLPDNLPPLPNPPSLPVDSSNSIRLSTNFEDILCITVEPFASQHGASGKGGVRLWSVQRDEFLSKQVSIRSLCLEGGPAAEQNWLSLAQGEALLSANRSAGARGMVSVSALPVYVSSQRTEPSLKTAHLAQLLVIASHNAVDVYFRNNLMNRLQEPREARQDDDILACQPIVTPYAVVVPWKTRLEAWTFETPSGLSLGDHLPGDWSRRRAAVKGQEAPLLPIRTDVAENIRIYPAIIGNRIWIPADSGKLYCVDLLPERLFQNH